LRLGPSAGCGERRHSCGSFSQLSSPRPTSSKIQKSLAFRCSSPTNRVSRSLKPPPRLFRILGNVGSRGKLFASRSELFRRSPCLERLDIRRSPLTDQVSRSLKPLLQQLSSPRPTSSKIQKIETRSIGGLRRKATLLRIFFEHVGSGKLVCCSGGFRRSPLTDQVSRSLKPLLQQLSSPRPTSSKIQKLFRILGNVGSRGKLFASRSELFRRSPCLERLDKVVRQMY
jgi:hypothetical protein